MTETRDVSQSEPSVEALASSVIVPRRVDGRARVQEVLNNRTWSVSPAVLLDHVLGVPSELDDALSRSSLDLHPSTERSWQEWRGKGWQWSARLFRAAHDATFVDVGDDWKRQRDELLEVYRRASNLPKESGVSAGIQLPTVAEGSELSVGELLLRRHSVPNPPRRSMTLAELAAIVRRSLAGVEAERARPVEQRDQDPLKSYGTSFDFYVTCYDVTGIEPGTYLLSLPEFSLSAVELGQRRSIMAKALIGQSGPLRSAFTFSIVAHFERQMWRYRHERALPLVWMDAARVASHVMWSATALEKEMQISPAVLDSPFLEAFGLPTDGSVQCLYNLSIA